MQVATPNEHYCEGSSFFHHYVGQSHTHLQHVSLTKKKLVHSYKITKLVGAQWQMIILLKCSLLNELESTHMLERRMIYRVHKHCTISVLVV